MLRGYEKGLVYFLFQFCLDNIRVIVVKPIFLADQNSKVSSFSIIITSLIIFMSLSRHNIIFCRM
jgi:hypothetical protein